MITNQIKKIDNAIYNNPLLLNSLVNDCSIKRGLLNSRLYRILPHRIGIEFELIGKLIDNFVKDNPKINTLQKFKNHFNIYEYSEDHCTIEGQDILHSGILNEIRVSLNSPYQLKGLYRLLSEFKKYCEIPIDGGIHIHVDISNYYSNKNNKLLVGYINKRLDEVESIFPKYTGTYNKREVGLCRKGTYVNISYLHTVEFRIAPLTFDYTELLTWIVKCNKFVAKAITECRLKNVMMEDDDKSEEVELTTPVIYDSNTSIYRTLDYTVNNRYYTINNNGSTGLISTETTGYSYLNYNINQSNQCI
jgi:hypothetical protein